VFFTLGIPTTSDWFGSHGTNDKGISLLPFYTQPSSPHGRSYRCMRALLLGTRGSCYSPVRSTQQRVLGPLLMTTAFRALARYITSKSSESCCRIMNATYIGRIHYSTLLFSYAHIVFLFTSSTRLPYSSRILIIAHCNNIRCSFLIAPLPIGWN